MKKRAETIAKELGFKAVKVKEVNLSQYGNSTGWVTDKNAHSISISIEYIME